MRVLLFLVAAMSVVGSSHPLDRRPARQAANRVLKGKFERMGAHYGAKNGETIGGGAGNALGQLASAALGTITGGNVGTKAGRSGLGTAGRITGEYAGAACLGKKNQKKAQAEALKKPVLYSGGDYQKAKLSRTGSSPALLQRNKGAPGGGASTSGNKPQVNNKGKAPMNAGGSSGASTSGTKGSPSKALAISAVIAVKTDVRPRRQKAWCLLESERIGENNASKRGDILSK
ncbi:unnamed protein product [Aphanomyces euteiches]